MEAYYRDRALQYENIYHRDEPSRQMEQVELADAVREALAGKTVVEVAAGTGYWTEPASQTAKRIVATDINRSVLEVAGATKNFVSPVDMVVADAFDLPFKPDSFDGGMANFWFSHLRKDQRQTFLDRFHRVLRPGATVFMADNMYNEGVGGELIGLPGDENTYKVRELHGQKTPPILKNYPTPGELQELFGHYDPNFSQGNMHFGKHFWHLTYRLPSEL